jgi:hypothetical protein
MPSSHLTTAACTDTAILDKHLVRLCTINILESNAATLLVLVLPGVRSDVNRAKEGSYNPVGTGSAWSHNFLNQ